MPESGPLAGFLDDGARRDRTGELLLAKRRSAPAEMARSSRVCAGLRPLRRRADTVGLGAIRLDLGSGIALLPKRATFAPATSIQRVLG